jgi:crotonobetainyl-CoA:carnitine CoA-transferase CaiB-like acyl-CoA transferase
MRQARRRPTATNRVEDGDEAPSKACASKSLRGHTRSGFTSAVGIDVIRSSCRRKANLRRSRRSSGFRRVPEGPGFHCDNRGKRSLMLDLRSPDARSALLRVIDTADVVTTNLLPARRLKYGLDHETLLARKPSLIVAGINGSGHGGDEVDRPAFDYAAYWARSGMMDLMRDEGVPPSMLRPGVGDHAAASNLVIAILAALRMRDASGQAGYVEVSLLQTGLYTGCDTAMALVAREPIKRHDRKTTANALWNSYEVKGGRWIMLVMIDPNAYWPRLCEAIERPDLLTDERFAQPFPRAANSPVLIAELSAEFAKRGLDEWRPRLDGAGLIWSPVHTLGEMLDDPQARAMGYIEPLEHPEAGRFESLAPPFRLGASGWLAQGLLRVDADGDAVLRRRASTRARSRSCASGEVRIPASRCGRRETGARAARRVLVL